jgi:peptidyl-prolyl cis-trans isomerase SurA
MRGFAIVLILLALARPSSAELVDGVAAIVDNQIILRSEVEQAAAPVLARMEAQHGTLPADVKTQIRAQALQALIDSKLIEAIAEKLGLQATEEEVDATVRAIARQEQIEVESIYAAVARQGLGRDRYREKLAGEITQMKVISGAVRSRVTVSDEEVEALFQKRYREGKTSKQTRVRHILLPWPPNATEEHRAELRVLAERIRNQALEGRDFGLLAQEYSGAPSAAEGGLTVFAEGEMSGELGPYVFGMNPGEISPPVQSRHGLNLIQVIERFDPATIRLEDARNALYAEIFEQKTEREMLPWMAELRKNRYVEVVAPDLR